MIQKQRINLIVPMAGKGTRMLPHTRGEIKALLINLSDEAFTIADGDRIAQMVIASYQSITWQEVAMLSETTRGTGGFGSTGVS